MRTSVTQFEVMVEFMERNGDLNKPADGPHGRINNFRKWKELAAALNIDPSGATKPADKWKKVWSDMKNNTKRKGAKINRAACGTGGGPACKLELTDLEQRVLNLMGSRSATGLPSIQEVGIEPAENVVTELHVTPSDDNISFEENNFLEVNIPEGSGQTPSIIEASVSYTPHPTHEQSPRSQRGTRRRYSPSQPEPRRRLLRRSARRQRLDAASEQFINSDVEWRNLAKELVAENARLRECELQQRERELQQRECEFQQRERELQLQGRWQTLFAKFLESMEHYQFVPRE